MARSRGWLTDLLFRPSNEWRAEQAGGCRRGIRDAALPTAALQLANSGGRVNRLRLAGRFEKGVDYTEREVNDFLGGYHDDYASLRRYLVDEGFLTRAAGVYRRR